jgi:ABC-type oligopeptide transport system substrate-binding subunit
LLSLCLSQTAAGDAESLAFRHGVSQIPDYELKYPPDFAHFEYVNLDAPKGGTLVLPYTWRYSSVSPMAKPPGYDFSYDKLIVRAADEVSGYYCSLAESVAVRGDGRKIVFRLRPVGMMVYRLLPMTSSFHSIHFVKTSWWGGGRGCLDGFSALKHPIHSPW